MPPHAQPLPAREDLLRVLEYDPENGSLTWKPRSASEFSQKRYSPEAQAHWWNTRNAGKEAFTDVKRDGYRAGFLFGKRRLSHRVIWKMMTGEDPECIDHIDGDPGNNRWGNLRSVSSAENSRNKTRSRANTSGRTGVYREGARWRASIRDARQLRHLGRFDSFEEACGARERAELELKFHRNHDRLPTCLTTKP